MKRTVAKPRSASRPVRQKRTAKAPFPSRRQASCAGLKKQFYPAHLREMVDCDYAEGLPESARQWLASFLEEHYRGFRLKRETQVTRIEHIREADAARKRATRGEDVMAFRKHLEQERAALPAARGEVHVPSMREFALLAGAAGLQEHELRARNVAEDELVDELDERRAVAGK